MRVSETENCYNCLAFHEVNFVLKLLSECCKCVSEVQKKIIS